jgi:hypothetical protein
MEPKSSEPTSPGGAPNARVDLAKAGDFAPLLYAELRSLAGAFMRSQSPGHTLQPTALVNEAYIRLAKSSPEALRSRSHFLAVAAKAMRHVLINHGEIERIAALDPCERFQRRGGRPGNQSPGDGLQA